VPEAYNIAKINRNDCCAGMSFPDHVNREYQILRLGSLHAAFFDSRHRPQVVPDYQLLLPPSLSELTSTSEL
jgi:hypothetical protein